MISVRIATCTSAQHQFTISQEGPVALSAAGVRSAAVETAEGLYKQARKRRRAGEQIEPLLEKAQADLAYLE